MNVRHTPTRTRPLIASILLIISIMAHAGCTALAPWDLANRLVDADGRTLFVEDLEAIAGQVNLSDDEKRALFRDLGIEDEKLIDALLGL